MGEARDDRARGDRVHSDEAYDDRVHGDKACCRDHDRVLDGVSDGARGGVVLDDGMGDMAYGKDRGEEGVLDGVREWACGVREEAYEGRVEAHEGREWACEDQDE